MVAARTAPAGASSGAESRPARSRRLKALALLLMLTAVGSVGLWQWRSPEAFPAQGNKVGIYNRVTTTALFGLAAPLQNMDPAVLTVHSVEPQVVRGDAQIDILVCHPRSSG